MTDAPPRRLWQTALVVVVLVLSLMWIYVLFVGQPENEDKLKDASFGAAAEPICRATVDRLSQIGVVNQKASSPRERADLAERSDTELRTMVTQLRAIPVSNADDSHALTAWLADWDQWLADRAAWVAKLEAGEDAQFLEIQRDDGAPNSKALNDFAQLNGMRSCATPGGV